MRKTCYWCAFLLPVFVANWTYAAPITQVQADKISAAANRVLLQGRNKANIDEAINALGQPSHVITRKADIDEIDEGASVVLAWAHDKCVLSYLSFDKNGRVRGADVNGKDFSSEMKLEHDFLRPSCPSSSYVSATERYKSYSCSSAKPNKYCSATQKAGLRDTSLDKRALINSPEHKARINAQFSTWDGSHKNLETLIKSRMHAPGSYQHVETAYLDRGDHLAITTKFRGKNAFGALVLNTVRAKVDMNGNVLELSGL